MTMDPRRPTKSDCQLSTTQLRDEAIAQLKAAGFAARPGNGSKQLLIDASADRVHEACRVVMSVDSSARMRHDPI